MRRAWTRRQTTKWCLALRFGWRRIIVVLFTAVLGVGSLLVSRLSPGSGWRYFTAWAAWVVFVTWLLLVAVLYDDVRKRDDERRQEFRDRRVPQVLANIASNQAQPSSSTSAPSPAQAEPGSSNG